MKTPAEITQQLCGWLAKVEKDESVPQNVRLDMGLFLDRVVELVEQSFREIMRLSIKLRFMPDSDLTRNAVRDYQRRVEEIQSRDRYRDVDFICGRLHVLRSEFEGYRGFTSTFGAEFHELMWLLDEREGAIIDMVRGFVLTISQRLTALAEAIGTPLALRRRDEMVEFVAERQTEIDDAVRKLTEIHNRILPLIGESEFLKIIGRSSKGTTSVRFVDKRVQTGGGDYARGSIQKAGRDLVKQRAGRDLAGGGAKSGGSADAAKLDDARRVLHEAVLGFPEERRETIQRQIDKVIDGINRKSRPSALQEKAEHLEMFLESGKDLLGDSAKTAWNYIKDRLPGPKSKK